jgi:hypothetical protein
VTSTLHDVGLRMVDYQPLPTEDAGSTRLPTKRHYRCLSWKLFAVIVTLFLVVIGSYRAGQLSVLSGLSRLRDKPGVNTAKNTTEFPTEPSTNTSESSDMQHHDKYSVG